MTQPIPHTHTQGLESFHDRTDSKTVIDHLAASHGVSCDADNESPFGLHIQAHRDQPECGLYFAAGRGSQHVCGRRKGHPTRDEDGIGHADEEPSEQKKSSDAADTLPCVCEHAQGWHQGALNQGECERTECPCGAYRSEKSRDREPSGGAAVASDYATWQRENVAKGTDSAGRTPRDRELGRIVVGMHDADWPQTTADRIAQVRADVRRETRAHIAGLLREVAAGRQDYLGSYEKAPTNPRLRQMRDALVVEISLLEAAAKIAEGDTDPLYGLLPSWRWTAAMTAALYPKPEDGRG